MNRVAVCVVAVLCCVAFAGAAWSAEPAGVEGKIESVTLYRGQALVTRVVPVASAEGPLVVANLPDRVRPDSLYAAAEGDALVRAVRFRPRVVTEAPQGDVRELDQSIETAEKSARKNQQDMATLASKTAYLDKLESFVATTAKTELAQGVLNADTLKTLTLFVFEQRAELATASLALNEEARILKKQLETLQRQRALLTQTRSQSLREAVIFLDNVRPGRTNVRLSYLVDGATWSPAYNLRAIPGKDNVAVEYNAVITQMSGEHWRDVALTLSTASPSMTADAPMLAPLLVALRPRMEDAEKLARIKGQFEEASTQVRVQEDNRQRALDRGSQIEAQWWLNKAAHGFQIWELYVPETLARVARDIVQREASGLSVNYPLPGRSNVDSRQDQQIARIENLTLDAEFTNVAIPLLTDRVHRQATVTNTSKIALLEGRGSVYLGGDFVGNGSVPMVASGQRFLAGFGVAPELRVARELLSKQEKIQGANREVIFRYSLRIDNYSDKPARVQLFDRVPYADQEIRVSEIEGFDKLSDDPEYVRVFRPQGILRWDVDVDKQAAGSKARAVDYSFKLEYDKNTDITAVTGEEREAKVRALFEKQMLAH